MVLNSPSALRSMRVEAYFKNYWDSAALRLLRAVTENDREKFETLVAQGTPLNTLIEGDTALTRAVSLGRYRMTEQLLQHGADLHIPDGWGRFPLMLAARYGQPRLIKLLVRYGANVNTRTARNRTAFIDAAEGGFMECVRLLLRYGADVNIQEEGWFENGDTALMKAAYEGFTEVVALLLKNKADIHIEAQFNGVTAINLAAKKGRLGIIKRLAAWGGDMDRPDGTGKTPLMEAAAHGHLDVVNFLLHRTKHINWQDPLFQRTALGWAVHNKHEQIAKRLLMRGADPWVEDVDGENAIMVAEKHGLLELAGVLLKKGERMKKARK
jgi:ankyrin repeat domain-containing protein 17